MLMKSQNSSHKISIIKLIILVLVPLLIELFVYNFNFFFSRTVGAGSHEYIDLLALPESDVVTEGLDVTEPGQYSVTGDGEVSFTFSNINKNVNSLYLDINSKDAPRLLINVFLSDDGSKAFYQIPVTTTGIGSTEISLVKAAPESLWYDIHPMGKLHGIKVSISTFNLSDDSILNVKSIALNCPRPMMFSFVRLIVLYFLWALLVCMIKYRSAIADLLSKQISQTALSVCIVLSQIILFLAFTWMGYPYQQSISSSDNATQYQRLAVSFSHGNAHLEYDPPEYMETMENPYDSSERSSLAGEYKEAAAHDVGYYNGKYYVYFGVAPVVLFYLPYYLATGNNLNNAIPVIISSILVIIGLSCLLHALRKKYFSNLPNSVFFAVQAGFPFCLGLVDLCKTGGRLYEIPIILGMACVIWGLYFWVSCEDGEQITSYVKLFLGSLCIAMSAGCRPTLLLTAFLAFSLFGKYIYNERKLQIVANIRAIITAIIPFIIIGALVMFYNYIRFDSPFDFGFAYNLTEADYTNRGVHLKRIAFGMFEMLIRPYTLSCQFPFLQETPTYSAFMGHTFSEGNCGGIFLMYPFLLMIFALIPIRKYAKEKHSFAYYTSILCIVCGLLLSAIVSNEGGICDRYRCDFLLFFAVAAFCVTAVCSDCINSSDSYRILSSSFIRIINIAVIVSVFTAILTSFICFQYSMKDVNPFVYYNAKYLFEFWH